MRRLSAFVLFSIFSWISPEAVWAGATTPVELKTDGMPQIPLELMEKLARYNESRTASLLDWAPGARSILISTRFGDVAQVHRVSSPGGMRSQLTFYPDRITAAEYEPTIGSYFIFSKDEGGGEFYQLFRFDVADASVTRLTDGTSRNTAMRWSRSGKQIAFSSTRRNGRDTDIWTMDPRDPQSARMALEVQGGGWTVSDWSPDGKSALVEEVRSINDSSLYLADLQAGTKRLLTPEKAFYGSASMTADGAGVYLITDLHTNFNRLARLDLKTGAFEFFAAQADHDVEDIDLTRDGRWLAYAMNEDGFSVVHVMDTTTRKELALPVIPRGVIGNLRWNQRGNELGFSLSSANSPQDVYSLTPGNGRLERWTTSEMGGLNPDQFAKPELVRWKSFDSQTISGFLYRPSSKFTGKRPVIINIHGGPEGQSRPGFLGRNNYFVNELGVAVIYPNVRGSIGYGKTFLNLDNGMKREDSVKDIGALLDWIGSQSDLDSSRVMVTGGSYGGYMTLASMFHYNDRFRCAVDIVGISNFVTFFEKTQSYRKDLRRVEYGDERDPKMRAFFDEISPLSHAGAITKPMFIVAGRNDPRVPWQEGQQITDAVRKNGAPVWFLIGENEGHGFARKQNQDYQFAAAALFVRDYLLK